MVLEAMMPRIANRDQFTVAWQKVLGQLCRFFRSKIELTGTRLTVTMYGQPAILK
jgi:hypothetical protein